MLGHALAANLCHGKVEQEESKAKDGSALREVSSRGRSHTGQVPSVVAGMFGDFALQALSFVMGFKAGASLQREIENCGHQDSHWHVQRVSHHRTRRWPYW